MPDIIVLRRDFTGFRKTKPQPRDLDLVIEIADRSLAIDLANKAALYARAAIAEYWILDITSRRLRVHRNPEGGQYGSVESYSEKESVAPVGAPDSSFSDPDRFSGMNLIEINGLRKPARLASFTRQW